MSDAATPPAPTSAAAEATNAYDRWNLRDPSSISYGYYAGSVNNNNNELSSASESAGAGTAAAAASDDADTKKKKGFYITTAINYTNGPAHMGHAYEAASADAIARFARLNHKGGGDGGGVECYFVTGADEHGEKIAKTAEKEGRAPIEICDKVRTPLFLSTFTLFFGMMHDDVHPPTNCAITCAKITHTVCHRLPMS
jgi:methionyl-tRNA synthetase